MFYALLKNVIAHKKHDQKKGKGICSLFLKCFMIFETEFFSLGVYSLPEFSITTVSILWSSHVAVTESNPDSAFRSREGDELGPGDLNSGSAALSIHWMTLDKAFPSLGLSFLYCTRNSLEEMIPQGYSCVDALYIGWGFLCSRNPLLSPTRPTPGPANPAVMSCYRGSEHAKVIKHKGCSWVGRRWAPALPLPTSQNPHRESQLHQFSESSPLQRQELSLGLMSLGMWTPLKSHWLIGSHPWINGWH